MIGGALLNLIILVLIFALVWWLVTAIIPLPDPIGKVVQVVLAVLFVLAAIGILVGGYGYPFIAHR